jgi:hypothetical protein
MAQVEHRVADRDPRRLVLAITIAGLALRVAYVLVARRDTAVVGDAFSYHYGANVLADGHGYIDPIRFLLYGITTPSAYHPPLYTTYLAAWSLVGLDGPLAHRLVSCLLGAATVWCVGLLGIRIGAERARWTGPLAAALAAVYPHLWLNDGALLSESAAGLAIAIAVLACLRFRATPTVANAALMGGALGLAALGRAEMVLLYPLVALPLLVRAARHEGATWRDFLRPFAAVCAAALVVIGPWVGYNLARFEEPVTLSTGLGATLLGGACDGAFFGEKVGYWDVCSAPQADPGVAGIDPDDPAFRETAQRNLADEGDESERELEARELAVGYLRDHKGRLITAVVPARVGRLWGLYRPWQTARFDGEIEGRGVGWARVALFSFYGFTAFGVVGLVALRRRAEPIWLYLVLAGIVTMSAALTFGIQRYRIPVDVVLPALAAVGIDFVRGGVASRNQP